MTNTKSLRASEAGSLPEGGYDDTGKTDQGDTAAPGLQPEGARDQGGHEPEERRGQDREVRGWPLYSPEGDPFQDRQSPERQPYGGRPVYRQGFT